jgi:hypothetical protein
VVQVAGATLLLAGVVSGGAALALRRLPLDLRRLGALGGLMLLVTVAAFLISPMAVDCFSARYLVPIILMAPFALAPAAKLLGPRWMTLALAPYLVSAGVAGWLHYGSDVDGFHIRRENGRALDEQQLASALRARGIRYGFADYWASYRLTFLFDENPVIVPLHESQDRYPAYRNAVASAPLVAYLYDPLRSEEDLAEHEREIRAGTTEFDPAFEEIHAGRFIALILRHRAASPLITHAKGRPGALDEAKASGRAPI